MTMSLRLISCTLSSKLLVLIKCSVAVIATIIQTASAWREAVDDLFETDPTTLAGMAALLRYADNIADKNEELVERNAVKLVRTLLDSTLNLTKATRHSIKKRSRSEACRFTVAGLFRGLVFRFAR